MLFKKRSASCAHGSTTEAVVMTDRRKIFGLAAYMPRATDRDFLPSAESMFGSDGACLEFATRTFLFMAKLPLRVPLRYGVVCAIIIVLLALYTAANTLAFAR